MDACKANGCCPFVKVFDRPFFKKVAQVEAAKASSRVATRETPLNGISLLLAFLFVPPVPKRKAAMESCKAKILCRIGGTPTCVFPLHR